MAVVGYATIQLIPSLQGFGGAVRGQITPVARQAGTTGGQEAGGLFGSSFLGSVGRIMSAAGIYELGSRIASGFTSAFTTGIQGVANLQSYSISFETLLGSASKAQDMIKSLYSFAAKTPFDVEGSVVGAQKLLGVGVAAKDVVPTLTTLGDAVGALGGSTGDFNSVLLAYSQIMARGKVSTQDLYQISNTGIPIFQLMSKALGKPVGEIQKLIETGNLASSDVLPQLLSVMNQNYGGAMAKQATTLTGLFSTMKDTVSQALATAMTPFATWLQSVLPDATTAATNAIQWISDKLTLVSDWFTLHSPELATAFQPFRDALQGTDWSTLLGTIVTGLGNIALGALPVIESLGKITKEILPPLVDLLNQVGGAYNTAGTGADTASGKMGVQGQTADTTKGKNDGLTQSLHDQVTGLKAVADYVAPTIGGLIQLAGAFFKGNSASDVMRQTLKGQFGPQLQASARGVQFVGTIIVGTFNASVAVVKSAVSLMIAAFNGLPNAVGIAVAGAVARLGALAAQAGAAGAAVIVSFGKGMLSAAQSAVAAVQSVVGRVAAFFPHSPALTGPFSGKGWTPYSGAALVDGFAAGIKGRQSSLKRVMDTTFTNPALTAEVPVTSAQRTEASTASLASSLSKQRGAYIGAVNFQGSDSNAAMVGDLNFYLRTYDRGGR